MNYIEILSNIFSPINIYESDDFVTIVIENDENLEEKIKKTPKNMLPEKTLRIITKEELENNAIKDLGVKLIWN